MAGKNILELVAENGIVLRKLASNTSSATGGTRTNVTHGLTDHAGAALTPSIAIPVVTATDVDHATTGLSAYPVAVVAITTTVVTVRCQGTSITFDLYVG